jgi:hypothetical protein
LFALVDVREIAMKLLAVLLQTFSILLPASAAAGPFVVDWDHRFGDSNSQTAKAVAVGPDDRCAVTGAFRGSVDFGGGALQNSLLFEDVFVVVFDSDGNHLWSRRYGDSSHQEGRNVAMDSNANVIVTGEFTGVLDFDGASITGSRDGFIAKLDADGNHLWSHAFGDPFPALSAGGSVAADDAGNVYMTGGFTGGVFFGGDSLSSGSTDDTDGFIVKFDAGGQHQWSRAFFFGGDDGGADVAVDPSGNVFVVGTSMGEFGYGTIFILKYDSGGTLIQQRTFTNGMFGSSGVTIDTANNVVWVGTFATPIDFGGGPLIPHHTAVTTSDVFVTKLDTDTNHLWSKGYGDLESETVTDVGIDANDNLVLCGVFRDSTNVGGDLLFGAGWPDMYVLRLDSVGNHVYSAAFGGAAVDIPGRHAVTPSGDILVTGEFGGSIDFGNGPLTSAGTQDIFLVKLLGGTTVSVLPRTARSDLTSAQASGQMIDVRYAIAPGVQSVELMLFDVRGRLVRTLHTGPHDMGQHSRSWPARDDRGLRLSSGVYVVQLRADTERFSRKVTFVR